MSGSPTAISSVTMQQVSVSAPAPPASSESASVRSPSCAALSSAPVSNGRVCASSRAGSSAGGLTSCVTKSRTVSRISSCSGLKRRSYMRSLRTLFSLDAGGLDHVRPPIQILLDQALELARVHGHRRDLLLIQHLDHLRVAHDGKRRLPEPRDHL